mmetsp:Transcript_13184/g.27895  ORF Transcript_13184/g.27895 Transcript_13184/m.27895 type:complete len:81 (-) Transcript_13184:501-743(-)
MGCGSSTPSRTLNNVDDSVHVMIQHDKKVSKMKGETPRGYKERAEHPLLKPKAVVKNGDPNGGSSPAPVAPEPNGNAAPE